MTGSLKGGELRGIKPFDRIFGSGMEAARDSGQGLTAEEWFFGGRSN